MNFPERPLARVPVLALCVAVSVGQAQRVGTDYHASIGIPARHDTASVDLFVPEAAGAIRGVIVFAPLPLAQGSTYAFANPAWRSLCRRLGCALLNLQFPRPPIDSVGAIQADTGGLWHDAAAGGADAVDSALARFARMANRSELARAKVLVWGESMAGLFARSYATRSPHRALGFIAFHSSMRRVPPDFTKLAGVPALIIVDSAAPGDSVNVAAVRRTVAGARQRGLPWAAGFHAAAHASLDAFVQASAVQLAWIERILALRLAGPPGTMRPVSPGKDGVADAASWMPDRASYLALRFLNGACDVLPLERVDSLFGAASRIRGHDQFACEYVPAEPTNDPRRLIMSMDLIGDRLYTDLIPRFESSATDSDLREFEALRTRTQSETVKQLGDAAFWRMTRQRNQVGRDVWVDAGCPLLAVLTGNAIFRAALCGATTSDATESLTLLRRALEPLMR